MVGVYCDVHGTTCVTVSLAGVEPEPFEQGEHLVTASGTDTLIIV